MTAITIKTTSPTSAKVARGTARAARLIFLAATAVFFAVPLLWMLLAPTKTDQELTTLPPLAFGSFENIGTAWNNLMSFNDAEVLLWTSNTIFYALGTVIIAVAISIPAGYALAMYRFPGRRLLLLLTLIGMILPTAATLLPIYRELALVGLVNTPWAVILPSAFFPFGVYLTYLHFQSALPVELVEAAKMDGATDLRVFWSLGLPLARPAVALVTFFAFVANWNNYFLPYVMLFNDKLFNIQLGVGTLLSAAPVLSNETNSQLPIHRPEAALAGLIAIVPIALIFVVFQRFIGTSMLSGAVKG
ncbi:carbohydrate ABC transporter permease [Herbiconiux sp. CPCC 205763]|uniref:Carbohydrate ABC transporter permease n=1 Tax=Herbiconiux aconitum TaxID=2970913 RepID=A0ABT2GNC7_9MICO|nr:carbohydrate ABC transporter permease [Herbiconiux aconitum]MCS5717683.1 carbohydrate ABC transporter permease [Herbiconiux aconitum]